MFKKLCVISVALLVACSSQVRRPDAPPSGTDPDQAPAPEISQIVLYARSLGHSDTPIVWDIRKISLDRADGSRVDISGTAVTLNLADLKRGQKLIGISGAEEGTYTGLSIFTRDVYFADTEESVPTETLVFRVEHDFTIVAGNTKSVFLLIDLPDPGDERSAFMFAPRLAMEDENPNPGGKLIYVANELSSNISVIDKQLRRVVYNVLVGTKPYTLAADQRRYKLYIGDRKEGVIYEMDMLRQHLLRATQIEYVDEPVHIEPVPTRDLLIVVNFGSDTIYIVDAFTLQIIDAIEVDYDPVDAEYSESFDLVFVLSRYFGTISVLGMKNDPVEVDTTLQVELEPTGMAIDDNKGWLYITNSGSTDMSIIKIESLGIEKTVPIGIGAGDIAFDPFGRRVYVAMTDTREILCVDPYTGVLEYSIGLPAPPGRLLFDDDEKTLYACLPERNAVVAIDPLTRRIENWIETGYGPSSIEARR
ncbi:MAG: YncE family protein [Candidatus Eisenbacteria bacterium]